MPFTLRAFSVQTYGNGYTHWHYKPSSTDSAQDLLAPGFFSDAANLIVEGDTIMVSSQSYAVLGVFFGQGRCLTFHPLTSLVTNALQPKPSLF